MTQIVIDASVALAWVLDDEEGIYADRILTLLSNHSAVTPTHWILEVTNGLLAAERKGRIAPADVESAFRFLSGLPITIDSETAQKAPVQTLSLARIYRLTVYDAAYLELSIREGLSLATLDSQLIAACLQAGIKSA